MKESAVFLAVVLVVSSLFLLGQFPSRPEVSGMITWSPTGANPCQGNFTGEAVLIGRPFDPGCSERWGILIPPSEKGNLSEQGAYLALHQGILTGVFLDNFGLQNATTQTQMLGEVPKSFSGSVCPVLYPFSLQPNVTKGMPCVLLAMNPRAAAFYEILIHGGDVHAGPQSSDVKVVNSASVATWLAVFDNVTKSVDAGRVILLAYAKPFAGWSYPIPPNYLVAIGQYAQDRGLALVYFG